MNPIYCYVATRNGLFLSEDQGLTWTQVTSDINTSSIVDMAISHRYVDISTVISGDGIATTPFSSTNNLENFTNGANTQGKEINFINEFAFVIAGKNRAASTGPEISMTLDGGQSIGVSFDVTPVFAYPGASFNDVTVMSVDFPNTTGGHIAIAGDNNNPADQIITRTYDQGTTFSDAIILPYATYGIIRAIWVNPEYNVVFACGEPGQPTGKLYSVDPSLTQYPVELMANVTVGDPANNRISRFAPVPPEYPTPPPNPPLPNATELREKEAVYFLDSAGNVYFSGDKGFTWVLRGNATRTGDCVDIIALNLNTVLVLGDFPAAVYQSIDGGVTFTEITQPSWTDPRAIVLSSELICQQCPNFYRRYIGGGGGFTSTCGRNPLNGTICKPPYIYNQTFAACATPSTIEPTNLLFSIDRSGSVNSDEKALLDRYINLLLDKIADRLADGSIQVGIVQWSSLASFSTPFSSDIDYLKQQVVTLDQEGTCGSSGCSGGLTDQKRAFCLDFEVMHNQSVARPSAKNVIMHFTDGRHSPDTDIACDLTSIGITTVAPIENNIGGFICNPPTNSMYRLITEAKASLNNGTGVDIYMVALGDSGEIQGVEQFALTTPGSCSDPSIDIIPTRNSITNNPYFFRAGTFADAEFIADQLRIGLGAQLIPTIPCPEECPGVPGVDNLGYCECREEFNVSACGAMIKSCDTGEEIEIFSPSSFYINKVVRLRNVNAPNFLYREGCWEVLPLTTVNDPLAPPISIDQEYADCPTCASPPWYRLTDCLDNLFIIYTKNSAFQSYIDQNDLVITHDNYPDRCFLIENIGPDGDYTESDITTSGVNFRGEGCEFCPREQAINFRLVNCADGTIIYCPGNTNDLQQYIGQTVNIDGYGNACWQVEIESSPQPIQQDVIVTASYAGCPECQPPVIYQFVNCEEETAILYSNQDFSQYVGQVINLQEYPGNCWSVSVAQGSFTTQNLTISGEPYTDCPTCVTTYYQLTNCANPGVFLISTSTELARYVDRTITAAGYTGLCFSVTAPQCNCIRVTINGINYEVYAQATLYNGRNMYLFETDAAVPLGVGWSTNPDRWELFDPNTLETYGFTNRNNQCPFSNYWTIIQGSPYIITSVTFCADTIYNIAPELDFVNCDPCINCI